MVEELSSIEKSAFYSRLDNEPTYEKMLEKYFVQAWSGLNSDIQIVHQADQYELNRILQSTEYQAVYWISHGAPGLQNLRSETRGGLFDFFGFDVAPIFKKISRSIKVLAVVRLLFYRYS